MIDEGFKFSGSIVRYLSLCVVIPGNNIYINDVGMGRYLSR